MKKRMLLKQGDITSFECDCIVNAANKSLLGGGGVDGAIHSKAGKGLFDECKTLNGCETGEAKITGGYNLKAKYIIHTVGPIYNCDYNAEEKLSNCYYNSLNLAKEYGIKSIVFPCISTGAFGFPIDSASKIAFNTISKWLQENRDYDIIVTICCFDERNFLSYKRFLEC